MFRTDRLAIQFAKELRAELTAEQMDEVIHLNRTSPYKMGCASHDFCDANMVMLRAYEKVTGKELDLLNTDVVLGINDAWYKARKYEFVTVGIHNPVETDAFIKGINARYDGLFKFEDSSYGNDMMDSCEAECNVRNITIRVYLPNIYNDADRKEFEGNEDAFATYWVGIDKLGQGQSDLYLHLNGELSDSFADLKTISEVYDAIDAYMNRNPYIIVEGSPDDEEETECIYQLLDPKGFDICGELMTLEEAKKASHGFYVTSSLTLVNQPESQISQQKLDMRICACGGQLHLCTKEGIIPLDEQGYPKIPKDYDFAKLGCGKCGHIINRYTGKVIGCKL